VDSYCLRAQSWDMEQDKRLPPSEILGLVEGYSTWIEVDLEALGHNLEELRRHTSTPIMAVVKNNAYGHGLVPVARYLESKGVGWCMVAKLGEALALRKAGIGMGILNMDPLFTHRQHRAVVENGITQTVYDWSTATSLDRAAAEAGSTARVFVKVDTGLNRVGVRHTEAARFVERLMGLGNLEVQGLFSTLQQTPQADKEALERFHAVCQSLARAGLEVPLRSIASTDATLHNPEAWLDLVRPGISLYGVYPETKDLSSPLDLRQALSLKTRVEQVKTVERGESVTYWGRFTCPTRMEVATLHAGFYDGIPREMANRARIRLGGRFVRSVGSVSLNHILVDATGLGAARGDVAEVIGPHWENSLRAVAEKAGWMVYSLLNHLNPYTPRVYLEGGRPVSVLEPLAY